MSLPEYVNKKRESRDFAKVVFEYYVAPVDRDGDVFIGHYWDGECAGFLYARTQEKVNQEIAYLESKGYRRIEKQPNAWREYREKVWF